MKKLLTNLLNLIAKLIVMITNIIIGIIAIMLVISVISLIVHVIPLEHIIYTIIVFTGMIIIVLSYHRVNELKEKNNVI